MSTKFEQLLDLLVNEETDKANELFHEIVVEKSREIYENLIAEEEAQEAQEVEEDADTDEVEEDADTDEVEEDQVEEGYSEVEEVFGTPEEPAGDFEKDSEDPMAMGNDDMDDMDGEEGGEEAATKDDVLDLKDALEELKAEFEALMAGEKHEEEENPDVHGGELDGFGDEEDGEEEADDEEGEDENPFAKKDEAYESRAPKSQGERMREYIEKVSVSMVDGSGVGSGTGDKAGQTGHDAGKSPVSSGSGKPTSGANASNIATDVSTHDEDGTSPKGKVGGLVKKGGDFVKAGTKNVASSASAKKPDGSKLTSVSKPSNKEFAGVGAVTGGDKAGQTGSGETKSPLTGAPNRAK